MKRVALTLALLLLTLPSQQSVRAASTATVYVEPQAGVTPLIEFIQAARFTLDGEIYEITDKAVESALAAAVRRGLTVRLGLEEHPEGAPASIPQNAYRTLGANGVQVHWTSRVFTYTHAKFLIRDRQAAWIGSPNWTVAAFTHNREFAVVDTDPAVVREAENVFVADWQRQSYNGDVSDLVLSPTNSRATITGIITAAQHTLDVYAEELDDAAQEDALIAAVRRGVRVRIVCTGDGDVSRLRAGGVQIVVDKALYIHAKAIVADGRVVFIGSENISATSLDKNREMGLILTDATVVGTVERTFAQDFGGAPSTQSQGPTATPTQQPSSQPKSFSVRATVSPNPMPYDAAATLTATTSHGASCTARVAYSTGSVPSSFHGTVQTVPASGSVSWSWHESTKGSGGTVTVTCTFQGKMASATTAFTVSH